MTSLSTISLLPSPSPAPATIFPAFPVPYKHPPSTLSLPSSSFIRSTSPASRSVSSSISFRCNAVDVSEYLAGAGVGEDLPAEYDNYFPKVDPSDRRRAGVLLHPTSLPGPHGIGDFGEQALRFIDWLHDSGCSLWQVLPLVPPGANAEGSPYSGQDANCGNTLLISLEELVKDGLLKEDELPKPIDADRVDFASVTKMKGPLVAKAAERVLTSEGELKNELQAFQRDPNISGWLEDAAYFAAIDSIYNTFSWYDWPEPLKNRHLPALLKIYQSKKEFIDIFIAEQFLFQRQWKKIRNYAQSKGVKIMGDMPIYVAYHSADVWANRKQFLLNRKSFPTLVSGVPPDAFSETGQLWDSPLYDWNVMEKDGYSWWTRRIRRAMDMYDEFRIDHFRGLAGYWAVPAEAKIATVGRWQVGPGKSLFDAIFRAVGKIDIIAEDLGVITEDVVQLRRAIGAPGMAVLQFAFGSDAENPHLPHNHERNQVVYSGTHDNETARGWWYNLKEEEKSHVQRYLCLDKDDDISWALIRGAVSSVAKTAVVPMQDILGLDNSARMNTPATQFGNWSWRIPASASFESLGNEAAKLRDFLSMYGRL